MVIAVSAQEIKVKGTFSKDSISVGERVHYILESWYPMQVKLLYPDSMYDYRALEYIDRSYYPTQLKDGMLYDSAVYELTTFEIEPLQTFALPVFWLRERDSLAVFPEKDSLYLKEIISEIPPDIVLREKTEFLTLEFLFNYPYVSIAAGMTIIIMLVLWAIFGKRIRITIAVWRLNKHYQQFLLQYDALCRDIDQEKVYEAYGLWKVYMEKLLKRPVSKWTSKEINQYFGKDSVAKALSKLDQFVYSSQKEINSIPAALDQLKTQSQIYFEQKVNELKNG